MDKPQADYLVTGLTITITLPRGTPLTRSSLLAAESVKWFRKGNAFGNECEVQVVTNGDNAWLTLDKIVVPDPRVPDALPQTMRQIERFVEGFLLGQP
jgi:hypothetical protein